MLSEINLRRRANDFCLHQTVYQSTYIDAIKLNCISCESMEMVILTNSARYVAALIEPIAFYLFHRYCLSLMAAASYSIWIFRWNVPLPHRLTYLWNYGICLSISFINFCMPAPAFVTKYVSLPSGVLQFFFWRALKRDSNRSASFAHTTKCMCEWIFLPELGKCENFLPLNFLSLQKVLFAPFPRNRINNFFSIRIALLELVGGNLDAGCVFFNLRVSVQLLF